MTQRQATILVLALLVALAIPFLFHGARSLLSNPTTLLIYVVGAALVALAIRKWAPSAKRSLCPDCGRAITVRDRVVFPEGFNADDNQPLPAIMERRFSCQSCNFRYFEVVEEPSAPESYWAYREDKTRPTITLAEWQKIKEEAIQAAVEKNNAAKASNKR